MMCYRISTDWDIRIRLWSKFGRKVYAHTGWSIESDFSQWRERTKLQNIIKKSFSLSLLHGSRNQFDHWQYINAQKMPIKSLKDWWKYMRKQILVVLLTRNPPKIHTRGLLTTLFLHCHRSLASLIRLGLPFTYTLCLTLPISHPLIVFHLIHFHLTALILPIPLSSLLPPYRSTFTFPCIVRYRWYTAYTRAQQSATEEIIYNRQLRRMVHASNGY